MIKKYGFDILTHTMRVIFLFVCTLFLTLLLPFFVNASVVINEIAWMGDSESPNNEWVELKGPAGQDLSGWTLVAEDGSPNILIEKSVDANGYLVLERGSDKDYTGALSNSGEKLTLKDDDGNVIDIIDASNGWPAGDNTTKETMQKSGNEWITAQATPKAALVKSDFTNNGGSEQAQESQGFPQSTVQPVYGDAKHLSADAGGDRAVVVGADAAFTGKAFGFDGRPLEEANFIWTFGDGSFIRGKTVSHTFRYPGTYRVTLTISSGSYTASDYITVEAIDPAIHITEVKPGRGGFVELRNTSDFDIDISWWAIGNGERAFYFPEHTVILKQKFLVIPYDISGIEFFNSGSVFLLYPNGSIGQKFEYSGKTREDESFHAVGDTARIGISSPASDKFAARMNRESDNKGILASGIKNKSASNQEIIEMNKKELVKNSDTEGVKSEKEIDNVIENLETASPAAIQSSFFQNKWFWLVAAIIIGIISSFFVFAIRKHLHT